jgi:ferredoxin-thioredoxin reductase catalytic subunit
MQDEIKRLYEALRGIQEPKGYYFNPDKEKVFELMEGLLINKRRYGYMSCPCRLATGEREKDKDIICPCVYRQDDVNEYGSCYCQLYVSEEVVNGKRQLQHVPERRPPEKLFG